MKTAFLLIAGLIFIAPKLHAQEHHTNSTAQAKEYRPVDVRKTGDGFSTTFSHVGKLEWTTDEWLVCDVSRLVIVGTTPQIAGVKLVIAEGVKCVDGQIATKDYGIIKARSFVNSRGEKVPRILMTPETIAKVKAALENKANAGPEKPLAKAKRIKLYKVQFDGLPLEMVLTMLNDQSLRCDPDEQCVKISLGPDAKQLANYVAVNLEEIKEATLAEIIDRVAASIGLEVQATDNELLLVQKKAK